MKAAQDGPIYSVEVPNSISVCESKKLEKIAPISVDRVLGKAALGREAFEKRRHRLARPDRDFTGLVHAPIVAALHRWVNDSMVGPCL